MKYKLGPTVQRKQFLLVVLYALPYFFLVKLHKWHLFISNNYWTPLYYQIKYFLNLKIIMFYMQLYLQLVSLFVQNVSLIKSVVKTKQNISKQSIKLYSVPFALPETGLICSSAISCNLCYMPIVSGTDLILAYLNQF